MARPEIGNDDFDIMDKPDEISLAYDARKFMDVANAK